MSKFYHLHVHSEFSVPNSIIKIDDLLKKCKEANMSAVAITDFRNIFGAFVFYSKAKKTSVKPIIGCELYVSPGSMNDTALKDNKWLNHLILLVKNKKGFENLNKLISISYSDDFSYKPRVDKKTLSQHSEGLIALSGCLKGEIPQLIIRGQLKRAEATAKLFQSIYGQDNFFLEIQNHGVLLQDKLNSSLFDMGKKLNIPLVATNDCRYLSRNDYKAHDALICYQTGETLNNPNRFRFNFDQLYFKSSEEMVKTFPDYPEAIKNTERIVSKCNLDIENLNFFKHQQNILTDDSMVEKFTLHESLRIVGKTLNFHHSRINDLLEHIPVEIKNLKQFLQVNPELMTKFKNCENPIEIANKIEGLYDFFLLEKNLFELQYKPYEEKFVCQPFLRKI